MIDRDVALLLIGAAIALASGLIAALVQHLLSLRADRIKRERDRVEKQSAILSEGASDRTSLEFAPFLTDIDRHLIIHRIYESFKGLIAEKQAESQEGEQGEPEG